MTITIADMLEAGQPIFGLPVRWGADTSGIVLSYKPHIDPKGCKCPLVDVNIRDARVLTYRFTITRAPSCFEVYADGIRVLDIDDKLYRVTGHHAIANNGYTQQVDYLPLIPDKPKPEPRGCCSCKYDLTMSKAQGISDEDAVVHCKNCMKSRTGWEPREPKEVCETCGQEMKEKRP